MSALSELNIIFNSLEISVETGVFKDIAPEEYVVLTPLTDIYEDHADNSPQYETQEIRISLFSKKNYQRRKNQICKALINSDFTITERLYVEHEDDTDYHHYAIDVAKLYDLEE